MKISYLADCNYEADKIAQWYFDEWAHMVPGTTVQDVREKVCLKALSRSWFPKKTGRPINQTLSVNTKTLLCRWGSAMVVIWPIAISLILGAG